MHIAARFFRRLAAFCGGLAVALRAGWMCAAPAGDEKPAADQGAGMYASSYFVVLAVVCVGLLVVLQLSRRAERPIRDIRDEP